MEKGKLKRLWQNIIFYKRISAGLLGATIVIILDIYFGRIISCIFSAVFTWIIVNMYPSNIKRKNYDDNG